MSAFAHTLRIKVAYNNYNKHLNLGIMLGNMVPLVELVVCARMAPLGMAQPVEHARNDVT